MNPEKELPENQINESVPDDSSTLGDFIKELEAKEKDLHTPDLVFEIQESDINETETLTEADKTAKEVILQRNKLDSLIKNTRRAMQEFGKSLPLADQTVF